MPEGDLRDLYGVVRRVSGRWRSGVRLTAEEDGEALQEKYGEKWLGRSATGHPKPPKVPSEAGTSAEAVAPESAAADDVSRHDEDDSGRPEESGKESQTEPATRDDLEDLLREAESWEVAPETDAAEAAKAVLEAEVARAEAQARQEAAAAMAEAVAQAKQEAAAAEAEAEAQAKQEAIAAKAKADEAAVAAMAKAEAQAKLPEKPRPARLKTSHDSFSSMPATSPPASDDGAPEPLPAPLQNILWWAEGRTRVERARAKDFLTYPVGQLLGDMQTQTSVKDIIYGMMTEMLESHERLDSFIRNS